MRWWTPSAARTTNWRIAITGIKAGWFGRDTLDYWDRNAPLPGDDNRGYSLGRGAGHRARRLRRASIREWRRSPGASSNALGSTRSPRPGKDSGAFCHPVVPSVHPYVLMNFYGRPRDVTTLAHELGHGIHQVLAAEQGTLMADTPLTLAESASVFGEMLVFRALLDRAAGHRPASPAARRQGREHAEYGGSADRLSRVRAARARRAPQRRTAGRAPRGTLARGAAREPRARCSASTTNTGTSGPTSRTSSTRRSTSTPMPSGIAW